MSSQFNKLTLSEVYKGLSFGMSFDLSPLTSQFNKLTLLDEQAVERMRAYNDGGRYSVGGRKPPRTADLLRQCRQLPPPPTL